MSAGLHSSEPLQFPVDDHANDVSGPDASHSISSFESLSPPTHPTVSHQATCDQRSSSPSAPAGTSRLPSRKVSVRLDDLKEEDDMADTRPAMHRAADGRSSMPLLKEDRDQASYDSPSRSTRPGLGSRRSTFRSRSPDTEGSASVRRKYTIAAAFLLLSLISFVIQTETAVYIQHDLKWKKPYAMLYFTHGSWALLWPFTLLVLRIGRWRTPWASCWRRHIYLIRSTAQMVESDNVHLTSREMHKSPVPYILRMTAFVTTALTIAGGSWYVAVDLTSPSDLTAIYNCSAFFAYAFSIPLLNDKLRFDKIFSVGVAIAGVLIVAYGDKDTSDDQDSAAKSSSTRVVGNLIIGIGSVLYGLYEVLYKKLACPPEGTSSGRGMIFALFFGSLIGTFTLTVLWVPLPIFHFLGWEPFELPHGQAAWLLLISVLANASFSGSFLVLISLTSPVLSSVAALLTIFLVAIVDWLRTGKKLSPAAIGGGLLIIVAFVLLSWSTYREMNEERLKRAEEPPVDTSDDEET